jgi:hypothetical protein
MAANPTGFSEQNVNNTATEHDTMSDQLKSELMRLGEEVAAVRGASDSQMTRALEGVYNRFNEDMNKQVVDNLRAMAEQMRSAVSGQSQANVVATEGVNSAGNEMAGFINPG